MEPKKKNDKKTTLFVIGGLVILLSATAFFVFRTPNQQTYRETRVVSMEKDDTQKPTPTKEPIQVEEDEEFVEPSTLTDTAYMTVTVPGFSTEDVKKKKAEDKDKEKTKTTTKTTKTVTTTQTTGQPAIVDHYYVDETGKQIDNPNENSDTVYVIEYDKNKEPTSNEFQDVISDYLKGDTTYVAENAKATAALSDDSLVVMGGNGGSTNNNVTNMNANNNRTSNSLEDDAIIVQGAVNVPSTSNQNNASNQNNESDDMIITTESEEENAETDENDPFAETDTETKEEEEDPYFIMPLEGEGYTDEMRPAKVRVVEDSFVVDPATQEVDRYGIQAEWVLNENEKHDGKITVTPYGLGPAYIKSLDYQCAIVSGAGYIQDTDNDFIKLVHVDDGSAIQFVVTATYVDDSVKTSQILTVAHKDYSPLNSNQVTVVEE